MNKLKIAFTGPESSGKTTLAKWLSEELSAVCCDEFARKYLEKRESYDQKDLTKIAKGQLKEWDKNTDSRPLIADTEMLVIQIWSLWKYGSCDSLIVSAVQNQQFDHYFLCKPDIPWEPDELRESENERDQLFAIYEQMIIELGWNYTIVCGDLNTRKTKIRNVLNNISSIANH